MKRDKSILQAYQTNQSLNIALEVCEKLLLKAEYEDTGGILNEY